MIDLDFVDELTGDHIGVCNNPECGEEAAVGDECTECDLGEVIQYDEDESDEW